MLNICIEYCYTACRHMHVARHGSPGLLNNYINHVANLLGYQGNCIRTQLYRPINTAIGRFSFGTFGYHASVTLLAVTDTYSMGPTPAKCRILKAVGFTHRPAQEANLGWWRYHYCRTLTQISKYIILKSANNSYIENYINTNNIVRNRSLIIVSSLIYSKIMGELQLYSPFIVS